MPSITVTANTGALSLALATDAKNLTAAMRTIIRKVGASIQGRLRRQVAGALGPRLGRLVSRKFSERRGPTPDMEMRVFSRAKVKRAGGPIDLLAVFAEGAEIRAQGRRYLMIPTKRVGRGPRGRRLTPRDFPRDFFSVIPVQGGRLILLVARKDPEGGAYFLGVRKVHIRRRLDVDAAVTPAVGDLEGRILAEFAARQAKQAAA